MLHVHSCVLGTSMVPGSWEMLRKCALSEGAIFDRRGQAFPITAAAAGAHPARARRPRSRVRGFPQPDGPGSLRVLLLLFDYAVMCA